MCEDPLLRVAGQGGAPGVAFPACRLFLPRVFWCFLLF
ncbi:trans-sialidase, putative, partial [Trypanosoma cruzi marinkellei]